MTKCPYCGKSLRSDEWKLSLRYMIGKGWIFKGTLADEKWKTDELKTFLENGWVEMDPKLGFRITAAGREEVSN